MKQISNNYKKIINEMMKYFEKNKEEDYLEFDQNELSSIENILNPDKPAPWDHFTNEEDDGDVDVDIEE